MDLQGREFLLRLCFLCWALLTVFQALRIGFFQREHYLIAGEKAAGFEGVIPARRGRILDRSGRALAWSEQYYDLHAALLEGEEFTEYEREQLRTLLPAPPETPKGRLYAGLNPEQLAALDAAISRGLRAEIRPRTERIRIQHPGLRKELEAAEKKYDLRLRGTDGRFRVLRDHYRNWIVSSWKLLTPPTPGEDVRLDFLLRDKEGSR